MRCTVAGAVGIFLLVSAALGAADFWQEKDFTVWSAQQVEKMLSDSPWAKKITIVMGSLREEALGGFDSGGAGVGGGGGARQSSDAGGGELQQLRRMPVTVVWVSALPVRQALLRRQTGADLPTDQQRQLEEDAPFYAVAVVGLPLRVTAQVGTIDEVRGKSALKPNRKERIAPEDIRVFPHGDQTVRVEFLFPKDNTIALDDKDVEFTTKLGDVDITKKFKLADMVVRGRLAL